MQRRNVQSSRAVKPRHHIEMTTMGMIFWGCGLFFLLAWIFVLGILVGRGFLPSSVKAVADLKGQISRLQEMVNLKKSEELGPAADDKMGEDPELAFYEKLSSKKEEAGENEARRNSPRQTETRKAPETMASRGDQQAAKASGEPSEGGDIAKGGSGYSVQLASIGDKDQAERLTARLIAQGLPAYYYAANIRGKVYYRVRCGRLPDRRAAVQYAKKLEEETGLKGFVSKAE